ncbi:MAG: GGDEF domain-containing protein, partial [Halioglobus sp.]|nr:GGDEF domain-containing protein [Halioglobus sp.]
QVAEIPMTVDVPSVAAILNSFILFLAAGERAGAKRGRVILGVLCLAAAMAVFFLSAQRMFVVQTTAACLLFTCTGLITAVRAHRKANAGDAITAFAALLMTVGIPVALYQALVNGDYPSAQTIAFGAHSSAYVLVAIGFLASVVIEYQQHLSHLATRDPLTRLLNRRGLESALQVTLAQAARQQLPTAAIMVDIDQFKDINDNFGHDVGDQVIRHVAGVLERMSRSSDAVARTGGEEFLLVLPQTDLGSARGLAERICQTIARTPLLIDNHRIPVTASLGVATIVGDEGLDKLSQDADRAMYLAKRSGSNRVSSVESRPVHLTSPAGRA